MAPRHERLVTVRAGSAQKRCRKGKSRVHVCGRLRTPDAGRIYAQLKGCALDHNEKDRGCSVSFTARPESVTSRFVTSNDLRKSFF